MYHGSTCDNSLKGERLGLADADHWNASYIRRPGNPIISPANGTGSHEVAKRRLLPLILG